MKAIVTGTTGYVGEGVLRSCLDDPRVDKVLSVSRRSTGISHPKLEEYLVEDFMDIQDGDPRLQGYDAVFFCAGITSVGTPADQYELISHAIPMRFAQAVGPKQDMTFAYVSGYGTSDSNPQAWAKVKRSTEKELAQMPFKAVYWYRPCIMRPHPGQQFRASFQKSSRIMYPLCRLFRMANTIENVAASMVTLAIRPEQTKVIGVKEIDRFSK